MGAIIPTPSAGEQSGTMNGKVMFQWLDEKFWPWQLDRPPILGLFCLEHEPPACLASDQMMPNSYRSQVTEANWSRRYKGGDESVAVLRRLMNDCTLKIGGTHQLKAKFEEFARGAEKAASVHHWFSRLRKSADGRLEKPPVSVGSTATGKLQKPLEVHGYGNRGEVWP